MNLRSLLLRCTLTAAVALLPTSASAHAYVVQSTPNSGERVDRSPTTISVSFDEPITIDSADALDVRGSTGITIGCTPSAAIDPNDATRIVCRLARPLKSGSYAVRWRVTSADTHVVHGEITFGVGVDAPSSTAARETTAFDPDAPLAATLRFLMLVGSLVACGAFVFERELVQRIVVSERAHNRLRNLTRGSATLALVTSVPALIVQAVATTGAMPQFALSSLGTTLLDSQWGNAWLLRSIGLGSLIVFTFGAGRRAARFAPIAMLAALASFSISGHALHASDPRLAVASVIADVLHIGGASMWFGGIAGFVVALPELGARRPIEAFSPFAFAAVIAIVLSGTYAAVVHVGSIEGLFDNTYGLLVLAKIVLLVPLLAYGFRNLSRGNGTAAPYGFATDIRIEVTLLILVVAVSAVLTGVAPSLKPIPPMATMHE